jgi:RNA-directed DNA polymerase
MSFSQVAPFFKVKYMKSNPLSIIVERPLVFLCGPFFDDKDKNDRRSILRSALSKTNITFFENSQEYEIKPFALIIDQVLNDEDIKSHCNIALIEEIVAACSFQNYIFLDTMSTALELGLFTNSYSNNNAVAMIPDDHRFYTPAIGEFVSIACNSLHSIDLISYPNTRYNKPIRENKIVTGYINNLIKFKSNKIPRVLRKQIDHDFPKNNIDSYKLDISFSCNAADINKIRYQIYDNFVNFTIPAKILFYLVNETQNDKLKIKESLLQFFTIFILEEHPEQSLLLYKMHLNKEHTDIELDSDFSYDFDSVLYNIYFFIDRMKNAKKDDGINKRYRIFKFTNYYYKLWFTKPTLLNTFLPIGDAVIKRIISSKHKSTFSKNLVINGKKRKIITYANNSEGYELRRTHDYLLNTLSQGLPVSDYSFAYLKGHSALQCVEQHKNSIYFYKFDIHDFFNSIKLRKMELVIKCHLSNDPDIAYLNAVTHNIKSKGVNTTFFKNWDGLSDLLQLCYVHGRLPIGLVTSPILSNLFMYFFDNCFHKQFPDLIYTRYSDDILVSSKSPFNSDEVYRFIKSGLNCLGLLLNEKKTREMKLFQNGSHVKFLGLNIVHVNGTNHITVGSHYLKTISKRISAYKSGEKIDVQELIGEIQYIRSISSSDYDKLQFIYNLKTGYDFEVKNNYILFTK